MSDEIRERDGHSQNRGVGRCKRRANNVARNELSFLGLATLPSDSPGRRRHQVSPLMRPMVWLARDERDECQPPGHRPLWPADFGFPSILCRPEIDSADLYPCKLLCSRETLEFQAWTSEASPEAAPAAVKRV